MIECSAHTLVLQCYNVTRVTSGYILPPPGIWLRLFGIRQSVSNKTSSPPNYWKISGKTTCCFFPDLCRVNLMYHYKNYSRHAKIFD